MPKAKTSESQDKKPKAESKKLSQLEYEKQVLELGEKSLTSEKIGETLRQEGIQKFLKTKDYTPVLI